MKSQEECIEWVKAVGEGHCDEVGMLDAEVNVEKSSVQDCMSEVDKVARLFHLATQLGDEVFGEGFERSLLWKDNRQLIQLLVKTERFGAFARWYRRQE